VLAGSAAGYAGYPSFQRAPPQQAEREDLAQQLRSLALLAEQLAANKTL
jgi:hypothetical protein